MLCLCDPGASGKERHVELPKQGELRAACVQVQGRLDLGVQGQDQGQVRGVRHLRDLGLECEPKPRCGHPKLRRLDLLPVVWVQISVALVEERFWRVLEQAVWLVWDLGRVGLPCGVGQVMRRASWVD